MLLALVHVSVILIGLLVFLLARNAVKLFVDRRAGRFGSRLNTRFVISFVFATALSSTALFVLSALLVSRAVNVWFELELSESLGQSVEVADAYYAEAEESSLFFARRIAAQLEERQPAASPTRSSRCATSSRRSRASTTSAWSRCSTASSRSSPPRPTPRSRWWRSSRRARR